MKKKLLMILLALPMVFLMTDLSAQNVTLRCNGMKLETVLEKITAQSGFQFAYSKEVVDLERLITVSMRNVDVKTALEKVFAGTRTGFRIEGKRIILFKKEAENKSITGKVINAAGEPIIGAYIIQKSNDKNGTFTDVNGTFSLQVPIGSDLYVSALGFEEQTIPAALQMTITVIENMEALNELVFVGYGSLQKKDLTGSISHVKTEQYSNQAYTNVLDMLSGKIAGFNANFGTSASGSNDMMIRGQTSLSANNTPLVVLDGVIYNGAINDINPADIESVDILKDASSAAVYGARSAAGVLIINTKMGSSTEDMSINFSAKVGLEGFTNVIRPYNLEGFLQRREDYLIRLNGEKQPGYYSNPENLPDGLDLETWLNYDSSYNSDPIYTWMNRMNLADIEQENYLSGKEFDWYDACTRTGVRQDYNVNISNSKGKSKYYVSLGRTDNKGAYRGDDFKTFRSRVNIETKVVDYLKVGINAQFSDKGEPGNKVVYDNIFPQSPLAFPTDAAGNLKWYPADDPGIAANPLVRHMNRDKFYQTQSLFSNIFAELTLPFGFSYKVSWINRYEWAKNYYYEGTDTPAGEKLGGHGNRVNSSLYEWQIDNILAWNKSFGPHRFNATFLFNSEKKQTWKDEADNTIFSPSEALSYHLLDIGSTPSISTNDTYATGNAIMARLNYTLLDRYLFTASVRRDGFSAFGINHPYAVFPSCAVAWTISNEPFFKIDWVDNLKLRTSYGYNGNRDIGIYSALAQLGTTKYSTGMEYVTGIYSSTMSNNDLKWEKTASLNVGLDFGLFDRRVSGAIDLYRTTTTDLLLPRSLPAIIGYKSVMSNLGQLDNKGLEFTLNTVNFDNPDFKWNSTLTFATNRNTIVHLYNEMIDVIDDDGNVIGQREADDIENKWFIGESINRIWDYNCLGVYQLGEEDEAAKYGKGPGDYKLEDINDDGAITQEDKVFQGYNSPVVRLGLDNKFTLLKNLEVSFFFRADLGHYRANSLIRHISSVENRQNAMDVPYWTPDNPTNKYSRLLAVNSPGFSPYEKTGFLRLQDFTLAYNIPSTILSKAGIDRVRLYFNAKNMLTLTNWSGWDPESGNNAMPRIWTFGIDITL